ncbi:TrkH family potassium uptake protein [Roseivirga sp.]|uniref:TrkH family potassium uptake protein n=1 Tax=Roseivirga sp. TaxID=1964215 RepID=UPI003B51E76B
MQRITKKIYKAASIISLLGLIVFIIDLGFNQSGFFQHIIDTFFISINVIGLVTLMLRAIEFKRKKLSVLIFNILSLIYLSIVLYFNLTGLTSSSVPVFLQGMKAIEFGVILVFVREASEFRINYKRTFLNPAQLFVLSFLGIILLGSLLLMLPRATYDGLGFVDALFTSTSAVCVTGLIVVDTGSYFTEFGQYVILLLIQIGGLGILTFASYFSYFFKGGSTFENQLALSDMTSSRTLGEVFSTIKSILLITLVVEGVSSVLVYTSLNPADFESVYDRTFFAVFHAISAFCNAGFSTLPNSLYQEGFRFNYLFQFIIILTFVFGGLGFTIVTNTLSYFKHQFLRIVSFGKFKRNYRPWILNLNTRVTLITTISLTLVAFIFFYIVEYNNTLAEHNGIGKVVTALFGAATPRTAGFNSIDMTAMKFPTVMIIFLLMWIGASPASTGGGIKTSTFAIATLNILSLAKGKRRIEIFRREVSDVSVRRAFATISLSLIAIGFGIMLISIFDSEKDLMSIAFECFSAYSTVGLSLGITADLSTLSKLVIIAIMFVGRVGMLSIVIALVAKSKYQSYRYPTEEITIN